MTTIPASLFASVSPSVLAAGGAGLAVNGMVLDSSTRVPLGTVQDFPSQLAVADYFGAGSPQANFAAVYFGGYSGATQSPGALFFTQYNQAAVSAYLRGGDISALPLATLQGYSGTLDVTIDSVLKSGSVNLSAATSFSNAAEIIANTLGIEGVQAATLTASIGGTFTCTSTGTTLTVSAVVTGSLQVGDSVSGTDSTNTLPGGCHILSQLGGTPGGDGTYQLSAAATPGNLTSCTVTSASTTLDVTVVATGAIGTADVITGSTVTSGTYVTGQLSGTTGGVGLYSLSGTGQTVVSEAMVAFTPAVQFDSVSGGFVVLSGTTGAASTITVATGSIAANLLLTTATGAVLSQGAVAATPAAFMTALIAVNQDWVTFTTNFNPDNSGNTNKQAFALWATEQNVRYSYVAWDTDITPTESVPATNSLGYILQQNGNSGTFPIYEPSDLSLAAFAMGAAAAVNYSQKNGRITFAFKAQAGLVASVTTESAAVNLGGNPQTEGSFGNGYNYYGAVASASTNYLWLQRGTCTGPYTWWDSYLNAIYYANQFQAAMLGLLGSVGSIPYNTAGNSLIENALQPVIDAGLNFGAWAPGTISAAQITEVNNAAGASIAGVLQTQGWYLQVLPASSTARASRTSPPCTFWYLDRGSVQSLSLASVAVQ